MAPRSIALFSLAALLFSTAAAEECAAAGECAAEMSTVSLIQKDVKLRTMQKDVKLRAGTTMAAKDKKTLEGDPFQRVWFLCKGAPPQPMTEEMKQAEIEVEDELMCTAEMTFEGLCCAPWATGLEYSESVSLGLKSEQVTETPASLAELTTGEIYKLCTEQSAGEELATMAARLPVTCFEDIFTEADLVGGEVGNETLGPGEAILRTRLGFFLSQGIPMDVIPKCSENVDVCPDGSAPAIVQDSWIQEMSDASLLQKRTKRGSGRDESAPASAGQNVLSLKQSSKKRRRSGRRGGGIDMSSGSFTLSSGGNTAGNM